MREDGHRLTFSVGSNNFTINDNLSGEVTKFTNGTFTAIQIDKEMILNHVKNLQEAVMTYVIRKARKRLISQNTASPILSESSTLIIRENAHYDWTVSMKGWSAAIQDGAIIYVNDFDKNAVLSKINKMYSEILAKDAMLNPKRDIVRRIIDVGLLAWVHGEDSLVVYEKDVNGNFMTNCLINGNYFRAVIVSTSKEAGTATLMTTNFDEIVTFPLDNSILTFYPADEEAFD